ncbi:hypothetical protein K3G39_20180 [Pontibacter sp. HSC-14F20]|uniref:hypothetical protein n=1 Tax=Pontibacter sp. HSC-14F20 TaxID=2864136 RepID=UPI001C734771|nr:hypothetical protein [Pontibacter sp. HSC-14F20]MBX0335556.1 hypothetical protein [Pontibacter sp. HSC-14F20]
MGGAQPDVEVITNGSHLRAEVNSVVENEERVYDLVTSIEDYPFSMQEFIDSKVGKLSNEYSVLVIYYDSELAYYSTMTVEVMLIEFEGGEASIRDKEDWLPSPHLALDLSNQVILKFNDWNKKNFDIDSRYGCA